MKIYKNHSYTRTVEVIKTSKKCLDYGWSQNVKVTTVWNDILNIRGGKKTITETRWFCGENYLNYEDGARYYTKNKQ